MTVRCDVLLFVVDVCRCLLIVVCCLLYLGWIKCVSSRCVLVLVVSCSLCVVVRCSCMSCVVCCPLCRFVCRLVCAVWCCVLLLVV